MSNKESSIKECYVSMGNKVAWDVLVKRILRFTEEFDLLS